mgnify:CR=1 FL=1
MGNETLKACSRRGEMGYFEKYLIGNGIDIGCGSDKLFNPVPMIHFNCRGWDVTDGDAQYMRGVEEHTYDFVYSSHCLEHMHNPTVALENWWRILKPGGYLFVAVPDAELYEQGVWPSLGNGDHKTR